MASNNNSTKLTILYCNMNRSREAHDIMHKQAHEWKVDIMCCSEPNWTEIKSAGWITDINSDAAAKSLQPEALIINSGKGEGFCWAELRYMTIFTCYISPNIKTAEYETVLQNLASKIQIQKKPVIIAGDFNARSRSWGSKTNDIKGKKVLEWAALLNLLLLNDGKQPTFSKGNLGSYIDLTFASPCIARTITEWSVLTEAESLSDHNYIKCVIDQADNRRNLERIQAYNSPRPEHSSKIKETLRECPCTNLTPESLHKYATRICEKSLGGENKLRAGRQCRGGPTI